MNSKMLIGSIAVIIILPFIYVLAGFYTPDPEFSFRGLNIAQIQPNQGEITLPTVEQDETGATMRAVFKPGYVEKITGVKSFNPEGLDLTIDSVSKEVGACTADGKIHPKAEFNIASSCAEKDFAQWKAEKKSALFIDTDQRLIVFGASGKNLARVYHKGLIASYVSPDMVQSDRKREACVVSAMLDHMVGLPGGNDSACAAIR